MKSIPLFASACLAGLCACSCAPSAASHAHAAQVSSDVPPPASPRGEIELIPDGPQQSGLPPSWQQHVADSSIPTDPSIPVPELVVSYGPSRQVRYHSTGPATFFIDCDVRASGRYRLSGTLQTDGNQSHIRLTCGTAKVEVAGPRGSKKLSTEVKAVDGRIRLTFRVSGQGAHFGTLKGLRLTPL